MFRLIRIILILLIIYESFCLPNGVINFPFKKKVIDLTNISPEDIIFDGLKENTLITEISIGTKPQKIPTTIDLFFYEFFIAGENKKSNEKTSKIIFKQSESTTFKNYGSFGEFGARGFTTGYQAQDIFINYDDNKQYYLNFILAMDPDDDISGRIGLKLSSEEDENILEYNFIRQLKKSKVIKDYYFTIKYVDNVNGNLIIGDLPENYDNKFKNSEYRDTYVVNPSSWNMQIDSIYTKSSNIEDKTDLGEFTIYFRLNFGVAIGIEEYRIEFKKTFMDEQINKGICKEITSHFYFTYYCNNTVDFSKMKNLYFYNKELNYTFEFTFKDLFFYNELDKKFYFLIMFENNNGNNRWIIGQFFFKKYQLFFHQEKKKIGIYTNLIINNENIEKTWLSKNKWYLILVIFLFCFLIALLIISYLYIKVKPKRKIKANELDDEYAYSINK